jgi:DNA repair protein RecO (recombination protein O)
MPLHDTEAFVLRTYPLAEADKICVFLTKDSGKVRGVARGARRLRSRFGSSLEPLTQVAITFFEKEGHELVRISNCEIVRSHFWRAAQDAKAAAIFSCMAELAVEFLPEREPNERVYRLMAATLDAIEADLDLIGSLRYFETWLLRLVGLFPDILRCALCKGLLAPDQMTYLTAAGEPRCPACGEGLGLALGPATRRIIVDLFRLRPIEFVPRLSLEAAEQLGRINYQIIQHQLERDLKSYELLRRLSAES